MIKQVLMIIFLMFGLLIVPGSVCAASEPIPVSYTSISSLALEHNYVEVQAKSSGSKSSSSSKKIDSDDYEGSDDTSGFGGWWIWLLIGGIILVIIIIAVWYFFLRK